LILVILFFASAKGHLAFIDPVLTALDVKWFLKRRRRFAIVVREEQGPFYEKFKT